MDEDLLKRKAAEAALEFVVPETVIGIGTGSTTNHFIDLLKTHFPGQIAGAVASSNASAERLLAIGIEIVDLNAIDSISLYVDGADEFDPNCCLIKGGGGALTREKIVAEAAETFVCIVDERKQVDVLGGFALPIEVIAMAAGLVAKKMVTLGGTPSLREGYTTDNNNVIIDVAGLRIDQPVELEAQLEAFPGVVTSGLFARRRADIVLMSTPTGISRFS